MPWFSHCTESHRQQCHLWTWKKRKLRTIRDYRWGVYLLQLLLLLPATSQRLSVTSLASCAPPLPGRCGLGGGITKAGPGRPLQCTSASTPPSWTYQSPPLPPKAPPTWKQQQQPCVRTVTGKPSQCTGSQPSPLENLDCDAIDEPEKVEMKAEKLPKIKLRSLPTAANASPFFPLLLAVLKRYSFPCFIFQWLYSRSINTAVLSAE